MDQESVILSEVSQTEEEEYHMASLMCGIQREMIQMILLTKQKQTYRLGEEAYGCQGKRSGKG